MPQNAGLNLQTSFQCQKIQENLANILVAREAKFLFLAKAAEKDWPWNQHGQESRTFVAMVATKPWPWPGLPDFTRPHFPGKLGQKTWKARPGQALPGWPGF